MNSPVIAINIYSVPNGKEDVFLLWWHQLKEAIVDNPGFIRGRLHRSLQPDARFNFINVVEWENSHYAQGYQDDVQRIHHELAELGVETMPRLFTVVSTY